MAIQQRLLDADARPEVGLGDDLIHRFRDPDVALDVRQRLERGCEIAQLCQAALARLHAHTTRAHSIQTSAPEHLVQPIVELLSAPRLCQAEMLTHTHAHALKLHITFTEVHVNDITLKPAFCMATLDSRTLESL